MEQGAIFKFLKNNNIISYTIKTGTSKGMRPTIGFLYFGEYLEIIFDTNLNYEEIVEIVKKEYIKKLRFKLDFYTLQIRSIENLIDAISSNDSNTEK